jgi:hypothetical protein
MNAVVQALGNAPLGKADYIAYLNGALANTGQVDDPSELFAHAFQFFEDHCDADLGTPGPLVHFLERFYPQYVNDLCGSVGRRPTTYTIWMLNRILNGDVPRETRERLSGLLRAVVEYDSTDDIMREQSQRFLDHQSERLLNQSA